MNCIIHFHRALSLKVKRFNLINERCCMETTLALPKMVVEFPSVATMHQHSEPRKCPPIFEGPFGGQSVFTRISVSFDKQGLRKCAPTTTKNL